MFADDAVLLAKNPQELEKYYNIFLKFCGENQLKINASKTKVMGVNCSVKLQIEGSDFE